MNKILVLVSTVLALVALCAADKKMESDKDVAEHNSNNVYSANCTTSGIANDIYWNFNNCTACGFNCTVTGGDIVYNKISTTLASTLVDPVIETTFSVNGIQLTRSVSVMTANFTPDQLYAVEFRSTVPRVIFPRLCEITFQVNPKGQPDNKVACASCEFRLV